MPAFTVDRDSSCAPHKGTSTATHTQQRNKTVTSCNVALAEISRGGKLRPRLARSHSSSCGSHPRGFLVPRAWTAWQAAHASTPAGTRAANGPRGPEHKGGDPRPLSSAAAAALSITSTSKAVACAVISTAGNVTTRPTAQTTTSARAMVWVPAAPRPVLLLIAAAGRLLDPHLHPHAQRPRAAAPGAGRARTPARPPARSRRGTPGFRALRRALPAPAPPHRTPEVPARPPCTLWGRPPGTGVRGDPSPARAWPRAPAPLRPGEP